MPKLRAQQTIKCRKKKNAAARPTSKPQFPPLKRLSSNCRHRKLLFRSPSLQKPSPSRSISTTMCGGLFNNSSNSRMRLKRQQQRPLLQPQFKSFFVILLVLCCFEVTALVKASSAESTEDANWKYLAESYQRMKRASKDHVCESAPNKNLCLPKTYSKFELPHQDGQNVVEIGIDIIDVLRINDKVSIITNLAQINARHHQNVVI